MPAPMYMPVATPLPTIPRTNSTHRDHGGPTSGMSAEKISTPSPTITALATVPAPGRSRSGIHSPRTAKLVSTIVVPSDRPMVSARP